MPHRADGRKHWVPWIPKETGHATVLETSAVLRRTRLEQVNQQYQEGCTRSGGAGLTQPALMSKVCLLWSQPAKPIAIMMSPFYDVLKHRHKNQAGKYKEQKHTTLVDCQPGSNLGGNKASCHLPRLVQHGASQQLQKLLPARLPHNSTAKQS